MQELLPENSSGKEPVDTNNQDSIQFWANELMVTPERLCDAVSVVGTDILKLKQYLGG